MPDARPRIAGAARLTGAALQLVALGIIGPSVFGVFVAAVGTGVGLIPVVGVGLLLLAGLVYVLYALAWLEAGRIEGLYRFGLESVRPVHRTRPGFGGVLGMLGRQATDRRMWRLLANLAVASLLGLAVIALLEGAAAGLVVIASAFGWVPPGSQVVVPAGWAIPAGILLVLLCLALVVAAALLHGVVARALLVPSQEARLAEEARTRTAERESAVRAADVERTRIERDLHDGVQPRLVSIGMTLGLAQHRFDDDPAAARALLDEAQESTRAAITELRQLARGIHAGVLDDRGLDAAISALAARFPVPVELDVRLPGRCARDAEAAVYFAVAESLTNAAKHAGAGRVRVVVRRREGELWARVEDDGAGGAHVVPGGGLDGLVNRVAAAGGTFRLESPAAGPTSVEVGVPCGS